MGLDLLLRHLLDDLRHGQVHPFLALGLRHEERVEHANALRQHRDLQLVLLLEIIYELLQRQFTANLEPVPQRPLLVVVRKFGRGDRLRETEEGQSEVNETILEGR